MAKLLDLDDLNKVEQPYGRAKNIETYNYLLEQCHKKIKEYNKVHRSKYCYYKPPIFLTGKPMYDYFDLVQYLVEQLERNGLVARFIKDEGLFICWDPRVLNQQNYQLELDARQQAEQQEEQEEHPVQRRFYSGNGEKGRGRGRGCGVKPTSKLNNAPRRPKRETTRMVNLLNMENDQFPVNVDLK